MQQTCTRAMRLQRTFQESLLLMWLELDKKGNE
jgi:hypothetical protein